MWEVKYNVADANWPEAEILFLKFEDQKAGAEIIDSFEEELQKEAAPYVIPISDLEIMQFRNGIEYSLSHGKKAAVEDLEYLPMDWYEENISCCVMSDDKVIGFLLVHKMPSDTLFPQLIYSSGQNARVDLVNMMRFSLEKATKIYSPDAKVLIRRNKNEIMLLARNMLGEYKGADIILMEKTF